MMIKIYVSNYKIKKYIFKFIENLMEYENDHKNDQILIYWYIDIRIEMLNIC